MYLNLNYDKICITNKGDITKFISLILFLLLAVVVVFLLSFSLEPCISKTINSINLTLCTQVGFPWRIMQSHVDFFIHCLVSIEKVISGFME